jgi:hypothetical protein
VRKWQPNKNIVRANSRQHQLAADSVPSEKKWSKKREKLCKTKKITTEHQTRKGKPEKKDNKEITTVQSNKTNKIKVREREGNNG